MELVRIDNLKDGDIRYARFAGRTELEVITCDGKHPLHPKFVEQLRIDPKQFCTDNGIDLTPRENVTATAGLVSGLKANIEKLNS
jgi:hypothetical protein